MVDELNNHATLDPGMLEFYRTLSDKTPKGSETWPLLQQREVWNAVCAAFRAPRPPSIGVEDIIANKVPVRLFKPKTKALHAAVIYGHGGGWVLGGPETHDDICAELAAESDCVVALVDYRLAPEHRHPAQLEDCLKVWRWMREQGPNNGIDPERLMAAGDSAGGQMSVALALTLRDLALPQLKALLLIYPVLGVNTETPSYRRNAHAPCLTRDDMKYYLEAFLGPKGSPAWSDEKALPLLAASLEGLPPSFITVAEHDPLHDDGTMFHDRLLAAGVPSQLRCEPLLAHSYLRARHHSKPAFEGFQAIVKALKDFAN
jgi:acetyl esterase